MKEFSYDNYSKEDFEAFFTMCMKLFKDYNAKELRKDLKRTVVSKKHKIFMVKKGPKKIGFAVFSVRFDYVEGATQSPVAYLEAIYVKRKFRKMGIAKELVAKGEKWGKKKGCVQIGSDTWLDRTESRKWHKRIGFKEEEELVHFIKKIK
jgi:aminoglycoside 6'-N-acetyltransferase I